jgi:hypothetical protein
VFWNRTTEPLGRQDSGPDMVDRWRQEAQAAGLDINHRMEPRSSTSFPDLGKA